MAMPNVVLLQIKSRALSDKIVKYVKLFKIRGTGCYDILVDYMYIIP